MTTSTVHTRCGWVDDSRGHCTADRYHDGGHRYLHTDHGTHGLTLVGADTDGHNGYVRGIGGTTAPYTALTGPAGKSFKTLPGAIAWLARRGFDAYGRRVDA